MRLDNYKLRIDNIIDVYQHRLFSNPNILGFGRGVKIINNIWTWEPALTVYVKKKISKSLMNPYEIIPQYINGAITDVIESGENRLLKGPAVGGSSIGNVNNDFGGTVTYALSEIGIQKSMFILSCNHVLTRKNDKDWGTGVLQDIICTPAIGHGGEVKNSAVGILKKIAPIYISKNKPAVKESPIDAAIAYAAPNSKENYFGFAKPGLSDGTLIVGDTTVAPGISVYWIGAKGGKQQGIVFSINGIVRAVEWSADRKSSYEIKYSNVTSVKGLDIEGDSGAMGVVVTGDGKHKGFGMLVAGNEKILTFTDLRTTLDYFKLELLKPIESK